MSFFIVVHITELFILNIPIRGVIKGSYRSACPEGGYYGSYRSAVCTLGEKHFSILPNPWSAMLDLLHDIVQIKTVKHNC